MLNACQCIAPEGNTEPSRRWTIVKLQQSTHNGQRLDSTHLSIYLQAHVLVVCVVHNNLHFRSCPEPRSMIMLLSIHPLCRPGRDTGRYMTGRPISSRLCHGEAKNDVWEYDFQAIIVTLHLALNVWSLR